MCAYEISHTHHSTGVAGRRHERCRARSRPSTSCFPPDASRPLQLLLFRHSNDMKSVRVTVHGSTNHFRVICHANEGFVASAAEPLPVVRAYAEARAHESAPLRPLSFCFFFFFFAVSPPCILLILPIVIRPPCRLETGGGPLPSLRWLAAGDEKGTEGGRRGRVQKVGVRLRP